MTDEGKTSKEKLEAFRAKALELGIKSEFSMDKTQRANEEGVIAASAIIRNCVAGVTKDPRIAALSKRYVEDAVEADKFERSLHLRYRNSLKKEGSAEGSYALLTPINSDTKTPEEDKHITLSPGDTTFREYLGERFANTASVLQEMLAEVAREEGVKADDPKAFFAISNTHLRGLEKQIEGGDGAANGQEPTEAVKALAPPPAQTYTIPAQKVQTPTVIYRQAPVQAPPRAPARRRRR